MEDDEADREIFSEAMEASGLNDRLNVEEVERGEDALSRILDTSRPPPSLVLLDAMLAGNLNGFEVLEAAKADERARKIPIVMLTSSRREEDALRAYNSFANAYVRKSTDFGFLIGFLASLDAFWFECVLLPDAIPAE